MKRKTILIDLDDVICDSGFLPLLNEFLGTSYQIDDFKEYIIDTVIESDEKRSEFYEFLATRNGYDDAILKEGAYEVLERLNELYDIHIYSACVNFAIPEKSGKFFQDKYNYLLKALPFIDPCKIIFTNTKNSFFADYQIDDRITNLMGKINKKILFTAYHNKNIKEAELLDNHIIRVNNWYEIEKLLINKIER